MGGARTDLSGLSATEARALFLLVGPAAAGSDQARAALRKLVRALPQTFRRDAEAAASAVMVDPARWGEPVRTRSPLVELLQDAVVRRHAIRFTYRDGADERTAEPWGLVDKDDTWYLIAGTPKGRRTFRVDRITAVTVTADTFVPPADFDLDAAWQQVVAEMEQRRSRTWATVLIETRYVRILRDQFGRHCHTEADLDDGRSRVRLGAPTPLDVARNLAGWGADVQVLDPPAVRAQLARIGNELAGAYRDVA